NGASPRNAWRHSFVTGNDGECRTEQATPIDANGRRLTTRKRRAGGGKVDSIHFSRNSTGKNAESGTGLHDQNRNVVRSPRIQCGPDQPLHRAADVRVFQPRPDLAVGNGASQAVGTEQVPVAQPDAVAMQVERQRGLAAHGARDGVDIAPGGPLQFSKIVVARQPVQPSASPSIQAAVAGPENGTPVAARQQGDDGAAAADAVD